MIGRGWGIALLALSVGLNLGLAVAVLQRRLEPPPVVAAAPRTPTSAAPAARGSAPAVGAAATSAQPPVAVASTASRPRVTGSPAARSARRSTTPPEPVRAEAAPSPPASERIPVIEVAPERPPLPVGPQDGSRADGIAREVAGPFGEPAAPGKGARGPSPVRLEELAARLGVPPEDRPRFIALQRHFIAETKERRLQLDMVRRQMKRELMAANPDPDRLQVLVQTSAQLQAGLERALVQHVLAARSILHGDAERRYLDLLSKLGPRLTGGGRPNGAAGRQQMPPAWQSRPRLPGESPGAGAAWRRGGGRLRQDDRLVPDEQPSPPGQRPDGGRPRARDRAPAVLATGLEPPPAS